MRESLTDSLNVSAFKGTRCKDARIIRCTESDRDKCESEVKKVNSLKERDKTKLQPQEQNVERLTGTQNGAMDHDVQFRPGTIPMNIEPLPNQESEMDENLPPSVFCHQPVMWKATLKVILILFLTIRTLTLVSHIE